MRHKFFKFSNKQVDLTIIGMGAAGTSLFIQLIKQFEQLKQDQPLAWHALSIELIERSDLAGPGYAYHPSISHSSAWTLNNLNTTMSLFGEAALFTDFSQWLSNNKEKCKMKYHDDEALKQNLDHSLYAPRKVFGDYCRERLKEYIAKARALGIKVTLSENTEVISADHSEQGDWRLRTECSRFGTTLLSQYIVITTGYTPAKKIEINNCVQSNTFDAFEDYRHFEKDKAVIIRGTGLTGIDIMKELLKLEMKGKIYLVSRSGDLPKIKPDTGFSRHQFTYLTKQNLEIPQLTLATILHLFCKELGIYSEGSLSFEMLQKFIQHPSLSALDVFSMDLAEVKNKTREWQKILLSIWYEVLFMIAHHIREQDREVFFTQYFNHFLKWAAGMTLENATLLHTVLGQQVELASYSGEICYCDDSKQYHITTRDGKTITSTYLINAVGAGYTISDNRLLNDMQNKNLLTSHQNPGGIKMDKQFHIIDPCNVKAHDTAWSVGAITYGSNPSANSTICAAIDALKVVNELGPRLIEDLQCKSSIQTRAVPAPLLNTLSLRSI